MCCIFTILQGCALLRWRRSHWNLPHHTHHSAEDEANGRKGKFIGLGHPHSSIMSSLHETNTVIKQDTPEQRTHLVGLQAVDIYQLLRMMRNERAFLVQTPEQYKFCYRVILEVNLLIFVCLCRMYVRINNAKCSQCVFSFQLAI